MFERRRGVGRANPEGGIMADVSQKRSWEEDVYDELDPDQRAAFDQALSGRNLFLTGGPGTGKSHTLRTIIKALRHKYKCAPTCVDCCASRWHARRVQSAVTWPGRIPDCALAWFCARDGPGVAALVTQGQMLLSTRI
eukprot:scaffold17294_cov135-Isochrysis_galbana.AAC.2